ncbi:homocitrate synthase [Deinococcus murrayi]|uniref:homocitrate synthase n=1 Tax=Deinococcus murrayi TaxID=68910 RepID=UPI000A000076|nr:homocitrate synthase [Deinococcus murrayi]
MTPAPARRPLLVDTTLREGEQFAAAHFSSEDKRRLALALDAFGVDYLEHTSPVASPGSERDLRMLTGLGLRARVVTHVRCQEDDVRRALGCGVDGVNLLFGTSALLRAASHGRGIDELLAEAQAAIRLARGAGVEVRFSCEDAFRTETADLLRIYTAVDAWGVDRVGVADTVGVATPQEVERLVSTVRAAVRCDIEFHGHNDGGCAVANAAAAFGAGATHLNVTVLGLGERNGIAPLSGLVARLYLTDPALVARYDLAALPALDRMVADMVGVPVPFNACITGETAFTHKAGLHTNAVLREPRSYEALDPAVFGRERQVLAGSRLTGRHAVAHRAARLGVPLSPEQVRRLTAEVKAAADAGALTDDELDARICAFARSLPDAPPSLPTAERTFHDSPPSNPR